MGIASPVVASMTVDGEDVVTPATPADNSLGVTICPGTALGARTGLSVYYHTSSGNTSDLTNAKTPSGAAITEASQITITMNNLGDNAKYFTFALVHGLVSSWVTTGLGTAAASLTFTVSPVRTPELTSADAGGCTATPPDCHALKSDADVLAAGLDMSFDHSVGATMSGAYFALTGAMGGYVVGGTSADGSKPLVASLGGPHFLSDGATLNSGSMTAFLPNSVLNTMFGLTSADIDSATLDVLRTIGTATTSAVPFTISAVSGGITLTVPTITFSSPKYTIKMTAAGVQKQKVVAVTPSKYKSTFKVAGKNVKANGKAVYRVSVVVKNKLGKVLKTTPSLTALGAKVGKPVFKSNTWTFNVSATSKGVKTLKVKAKGSLLKTLSVTFVKA